MQSIHKNITPEDFIIIVKPVQYEEEEILDNEGRWTGDVQVSIVANATETTLNEQEFNNMIMLCNCAAASIPAMEENVFISELMHSYAQKNMIMPMAQGSEFSDMVLTLDTDTEGSA